jgi:hypothetical protein
VPLAAFAASPAAAPAAAPATALAACVAVTSLAAPDMHTDAPAAAAKPDGPAVWATAPHAKGTRQRQARKRDEARPALPGREASVRRQTCLADTLPIEEPEATPDASPRPAATNDATVVPTRGDVVASARSADGPAPHTRRGKRAERRQARERDEAELVRACLASPAAEVATLRCVRARSAIVLVLAVVVAVAAVSLTLSAWFLN